MKASPRRRRRATCLNDITCFYYNQSRTAGNSSDQIKTTNHAVACAITGPLAQGMQYLTSQGDDPGQRGHAAMHVVGVQNGQCGCLYHGLDRGLPVLRLRHALNGLMRPFDIGQLDGRAIAFEHAVD